MTNVLDRIKAYKLDEIAARKAARSQGEIEALAWEAPRVRDFAGALQAKVVSLWVIGPLAQEDVGGSDDLIEFAVEEI